MFCGDDLDAFRVALADLKTSAEARFGCLSEMLVLCQVETVVLYFCEDASATKADDIGYVIDMNVTPWFVRKPSQQLYNDLLFPKLAERHRELKNPRLEAGIQNPYVVANVLARPTASERPGDGKFLHVMY